MFLLTIYAIRFWGNYDIIKVLAGAVSAGCFSIVIAFFVFMFNSGNRRWTVSDEQAMQEFKEFEKVYINKLMKSKKITIDEYEEYLKTI